MAVVNNFDLGNKLPFYWRLTNSFERDSQVPELLEFAFTNLNGVISVARTPELLKSLTKVYSLDYNIGYIQEDYEIAQPFVEDFQKFLFKYSQTLKLESNVLEIGCGGGLLLKELMAQGFNVVGIDPSPTALRAARKYGFKFLPDFFNADIFLDKFDLIFHSDVLEHAFDPRKFIAEQRAILNKNGIIVISVPDATESITYGDISIAMHQHLQYFSIDSLKNLMIQSGFKILEIRPAGYGGSLYCAAQLIDETTESMKLKSLECETQFPNFQESVNRFNQLFSKLEGEIGFYVPLRALPYLCAAGIDLKSCKYRFFDDTAHWHGKHFDGTAIPIENFQDAVRNPPETIIIMSLTFEKQIKGRLTKEFGNEVKVITLREVLDKS